MWREACEDEGDEFDSLWALEERAEKELSVLEKLIEQTKENIEKLDDYIDRKYKEIKTLASKKPTRINWEKAQGRTHMSMFYQKEYGFAPSNEDALKITEFQMSISNYRKKYEYKKSEWTKREIELLFDLVEKTSRKYAIRYLIDENLPYDVKVQKRKEIEDSKDVKNLLSKIKLHFDAFQKLSTGGEGFTDYPEGSPPDGITNFAEFSNHFWNEVASYLTNTQTSRECQKTWLYHCCFEDPKQKKWNKEEKEKLLSLCKKYEKREWTNIARELNTNRSPLSCFMEFIKLTKMYEQCHDKVKLERIGFNLLEDIQLQILVSILGDKNWNEVKLHMENLNSNNKRVQMRKGFNPCTGEKDKRVKKKLSDEISYKRRYLRLVRGRRDMH
ncbi:transcription factor MYB1, putative [Plasmodium knowlesi strain H]|uniref:Transcription factor MYB1, putative n=3 Tax=Plasmodium knowlesi TaxID=5850 RepID=A0A5K1V0J0_PLAKH|nr:transcription factor MYB1, putative [Plasmodium knowlesi strain H]OTN63993.1 putative Myb1 protein [Plasmodium knowlesi]CAA9990765.1 transcription factor MYB1, putative [Plasmodium knowlesi strain H]SBO21122.1 transcription factor MYB1, putative [Plasmodium knowlesi strain H]SBO21592.1 transcription factor MYB1, putative [Plasmodium knowlesi strain H]VVS80239.1 transcription factor MYB1, putative [Plasmodium knowlesi strain H]|eukprot:XP_002262055.1 Myb1 protein, putative [Plasmodium knowlesi strain H]